MSLIDAMKFRENIRFFKQDEYPTELEIKALIRDAHELVPQKNNIVECNIDVYGPKWAKEKEKLVLSTMCGVSKKHWREGGKHEGDYDLLKKVYDRWRKRQERPRVRKYEPDSSDIPYPDMQFNEQVRAPYLLVYTQRLRRPTLNQKKRGYPEYIYKFTKKDDDSLSWYISAAMHGISLNYLAADRGIYGSFCKCFHWDDNNATEILEPVKVKWKTPSRLSPAGKQIGEKDRVSIDMKRIAFMIGLGYRDKTGWYPKETNYSIPSEYVKWK